MTDMRTAKILVVEDEELVRSFLLEVLKREGYVGLAASDAGRALALLDEADIDLVLLDLHMPGPADGEDLLYLLRDRGDEVPIIIVSGWIEDEAAVEELECVHAVLRKPVRIGEFLDTVRQVLALA